ncbi:MAG: alpha/beta hydrolase [Ferruginibacter sp.]|nr:alpha/beta hydrolase [Rhodoferax sp.]
MHFLPSALLVVAAVVMGSSAQAQSLFSSSTLPGLSHAHPVPVLQGEPVLPPLRYRVMVLVGVGCSGMAGMAASYFAGLPHARLLVLHKPGVDLHAGWEPRVCPTGFGPRDQLARWQESARAALRADAVAHAGAAPVPQLLVGIGEGVDMLPALATEVPHLAGLVVLGAAGLDPVETGLLQAQRSGQLAAWQSLDRARRSDAADSTEVQGHRLRYWRDLWRWRTAQPLINAPWPLLQVWGDADARVPAAAYLRFAEQAAGRAAPLCTRRVPGGDPGVQQVWAWLEKWAQAPEQGLCEATLP